MVKSRCILFFTLHDHEECVQATYFDCVWIGDDA